MVDDDFPKDRGPRHMAGRTAARTLADDSSLTWLRKRRFGAEARNRGGRLEVFPTGGQTLDGYYSLGYVDGLQRVVGSRTARGNFTDRGPFVASDGFDPTAANLLRYYGRGLGAAYTVEYEGDTLDLNGKPSNTYVVHVAITRNGTNFRDKYAFISNRPYTSAVSSYLTRISSVGPCIFSPFGAAPQFRALGVGFCSMNNVGQYFHGFAYDDGNSPVYGNTLTMPNQLANDFFPYATGPGRLVAMATYLRPEYTAGNTAPIDVLACPGVVFQFSDDGGRNWSLASSAELFHEFFDTVLPLPNTLLGNAAFNQASSFLSLVVAPIAADVSIAYAVVPYAEAIAELPGQWRIKGKVKLGLIRHADRTILSTATLFDDADVTKADRFANGGIAPVAGGAVVMTKPPGEVDYRDDKPVMLFTPDGVSIETMPAAPFAAWLTGYHFGISPNTIVCPFYDGAYSLYESRDRGATWAKRAVLSTDGTAPVRTAGVNYLLDFASVTQLRDNDQPANATPSAPWISDSRIEAPIL